MAGPAAPASDAPEPELGVVPELARRALLACRAVVARSALFAGVGAAPDAAPDGGGDDGVEDEARSPVTMLEIRAAPRGGGVIRAESGLDDGVGDVAGSPVTMLAIEARGGRGGVRGRLDGVDGEDGEDRENRENTENTENRENTENTENRESGVDEAAGGTGALGPLPALDGGGEGGDGAREKAGGAEGEHAESREECGPGECTAPAIPRVPGVAECQEDGHDAGHDAGHNADPTADLAPRGHGGKEAEHSPVGSAVSSPSESAAGRAASAELREEPARVPDVAPGGVADGAAGGSREEGLAAGVEAVAPAGVPDQQTGAGEGSRLHTTAVQPAPQAGEPADLEASDMVPFEVACELPRSEGAEGAKGLEAGGPAVPQPGASATAFVSLVSCGTNAEDAAGEEATRGDDAAPVIPASATTSISSAVSSGLKLETPANSPTGAAGADGALDMEVCANEEELDFGEYDPEDECVRAAEQGLVEVQPRFVRPRGEDSMVGRRRGAPQGFSRVHDNPCTGLREVKDGDCDLGDDLTSVDVGPVSFSMVGYDVETLNASMLAGYDLSGMVSDPENRTVSAPGGVTGGNQVTRRPSFGKKLLRVMSITKHGQKAAPPPVPEAAELPGSDVSGSLSVTSAGGKHDAADGGVSVRVTPNKISTSTCVQEPGSEAGSEAGAEKGEKEGEKEGGTLIKRLSRTLSNGLHAIPPGPVRRFRRTSKKMTPKVGMRSGDVSIPEDSEPQNSHGDMGGLRKQFTAPVLRSLAEMGRSRSKGSADSSSSHAYAPGRRSRLSRPLLQDAAGGKRDAKAQVTG